MWFYADHWASTWQFVKETLPLEEEPFWQEEGIEAYRVRQPSGSDSFRLELGVPGSLPYRGEGWDAAEVDEPYAAAATWATADASRLFIPLRNVKPDATYRVRVRVHPFAYPGSPPQQVMLTVNGNPLSAQPLADEWQTLEWRIAGSQLQSTLNRVTLHWSQLASPRLVLGGNRELGSTGVSLPVDVDLKAFADGGFIALFDEAGTQIDASAGRRGVNVTVLDAQSGTLIDAAGFDTTANRFESEQLGDYLAGLAHGRIVLVASYGDAWRYLEEGAINGLRNLGADVSMETVQNQYFVIAGVQGAAPGSAELAVGGEDAFLRISLNRDRRMLAAAVDWVEVQGDE